MLIMKLIRQIPLALIVMLMGLNSALAESSGANESLSDKAAGVAERVGGAIEKGAKAAAHGIDRGAKAAASGVEHGVKAAAHGVERGAKATADAAHSVAGKVDGSSKSSPESAKDALAK